jgi:hypothetical protein
LVAVGLLAFYDASLRSMTVVDAAGSSAPTISLLPNELGLLGSWSPGASLVLAEMLFRREQHRHGR